MTNAISLDSVSWRCVCEARSSARNDRDFAQFEAINREVFDTFAVDGKIEIDIVVSKEATRLKDTPPNKRAQPTASLAVLACGG